MDDMDRAYLERMAKAQEQIAGIMGKPENKIVRAMSIAALSASLLGASLFGIIDFVIKSFLGG
ncbi:hypothetical protein AGMMS49942_18540 [Spirochaetia bacterium]|nr:hypothetical protein AGMMS49942_18540 [Spirochaetia bacterium]